MKKISTLLGLGLVLSASGVRAGEMPVMPSQAEPGMEAPFYGDDHSACCGDRCRGGCLHRFCEWLTYRPLTRPCLCDCCHHCTGCCYPPLYTFFLCQHCNGYPPAMAHGGPACTCGAPVPNPPAAAPDPNAAAAPASPAVQQTSATGSWSSRALTLMSHRAQ